MNGDVPLKVASSSVATLSAEPAAEAINRGLVRFNSLHQGAVGLGCVKPPDGLFHACSRHPTLLMCSPIMAA